MFYEKSINHGIGNQRGGMSSLKAYLPKTKSFFEEERKLNQNNLKNIGLTETFYQAAKAFDNLFIGRVSSQAKNLYRVITAKDEIIAEISGKYRYHAQQATDYPAVGDFVMVDRLTNMQGTAVIEQLLPRQSVFARKQAGNQASEQIIAANIDTVFICMSLNEDYNLRRLERYLAIAWDSGATPVVVLTKADLAANIELKLAEIGEIAIGVDVLTTSSVTHEGDDAMKKYLYQGQTVAFIGSSGVGKSTLINQLLGKNLLATKAIRADDDKGRHTTTRRELIPLPAGGVVIDTPGMRELGIVHADLAHSFTDVEVLASQCKFNDCTHTQEPGCAVQQALREGTLAPERLASYRKLKKEAQYQGLNAKMIERTKANTMLRDMGGLKNYKKMRQSIKRRDGRSR